MALAAVVPLQKHLSPSSGLLDRIAAKEAAPELVHDIEFVFAFQTLPSALGHHHAAIFNGLFFGRERASFSIGFNARRRPVAASTAVRLRSSGFPTFESIL